MRSTETARQAKAKARAKIARLKATMTKAWRIWCKADTAKERAERAEGKTYAAYRKAQEALEVAQGD